MKSTWVLVVLAAFAPLPASAQDIHDLDGLREVAVALTAQS